MLTVVSPGIIVVTLNWLDPATAFPLVGTRFKAGLGSLSYLISLYIIGHRNPPLADKPVDVCVEELSLGHLGVRLDRVLAECDVSRHRGRACLDAQDSGGEARQLGTHSFARYSLMFGQVLDEVGARGGEQCVGGETAVIQAGDLLQHGLEQFVPLLVMRGLVRAAAPGRFKGERERAVVEFEAQDGVEQGGYALKRRGGGTQGRRAGFHGFPDRFDSGLVEREEQSSAVTEGAEERSLADAGGRRDVGHGDVLGAFAAVEQGVGGGENSLPVPDGVLAG